MDKRTGHFGGGVAFGMVGEVGILAGLRLIDGRRRGLRGRRLAAWQAVTHRASAGSDGRW